MKIGVVKINWGGLGLDNIFSAFCQIFLDKIKKMLYNKSTLIKYNSEFVNMSNRGRVKNAKIKYCKMLHFFATLFLTGIKLHLHSQNAARIAKNLAFFAVRKPIATLKIPLRQVVSILELFWNYLGII